MNKKIIFVLYSLCVGGAERRAASIANYLVKQGFEMEILLLDKPDIRFELDERVKVVYLCNGIEDHSSNIPDRVEVFQSELRQISQLNKAKLKTSKLISKKRYQAYEQLEYFKTRYSNKIYDYVKKKPDYIVVSWMTFANISTCYALNELKNECLIVECMSPEAEFPNGHHMNVLRQNYYSRAQKCICQTPDEAEYYSYLSNTKKYIIPNPINGNYPERFEGLRRKCVVNFCRLAKAKNIPLLIDAFNLFRDKHPEYELHIFGEGGEKDRLIKYTFEQGLSDSVHFFDFDVNIHNIIRDYAMFVTSSDREGMSNSMLEAMAIGLPTISTDCPAGAARMLIDNYVNGIVVPMRDKQAMCEAMSYIADHPEEAEQMSKEAVKIKDELLMEKIGKLWMEAILE